MIKDMKYYAIFGKKEALTYIELIISVTTPISLGKKLLFLNLDLIWIKKILNMKLIF